MHPNTILMFFGLALPMCAVAQKNEQAYCDMAKAPNKNDCLNIKNNGIKDNAFYKDDQWSSGNCRIKVSSGSFKNKPSVPGHWLKRMVQDIVDVCDSGFKYHDGLRVDVVLCTYQQGKVQGECRGPLHKDYGLKREVDSLDADLMAPTRRHLTDIGSIRSENPAHILARATEIQKGIICGGGPGSARIDDCKRALDELKAAHKAGKKVKLPYKKHADGCQVEVYPTTRDKKETETSHITYSIEEDLDLCADKTKKYVGMVENYNGYGYHFFFGQFCGAFNTGRSGSCVPSGK